MQLAYDGIVFDLLLLEDWQREAEYSSDQTTFLWWKHTITVVCMLNADATTAARFPALPFAVTPKRAGPVGAPGQVANTARSGLGYKVLQRRQDLDDFELGVQPGRNREEAFRQIEEEVRGKPLPPLPLDPSQLGEAAAGGFGGALGIGGLKAKRFGVGKKAPQSVQRNPFEVRARPALMTNAPTVPATDVELRARLRRPRRQLLVWLYSGPNGASEFMLVSPLHPTAGTDAKTGPICTILDCPAVHGETSAVMRLQFTTWEAPALEWTNVDRLAHKLKSAPDNIKDVLQKAAKPGTTESKMFSKASAVYNSAIARGLSPADAVKEAREKLRQQGVRDAAREVLEAVAIVGGVAAAAAAALLDADAVKKGDQIAKRMLATPALVSHRWSMSFGWNPDTHLKTQTIKGEAIFRGDVLSMRGLTADQLRGYLWHPIPEGYKRLPVGSDDVSISPDGLAIEYQVHDEQQLMNFPGGARWGVVDIDVEQNVTYNSGKLIGDVPEVVQ